MPPTIPDALVGSPPSGWKDSYGRPDAFGPFMVEAPGWTQLGGWLRFLPDDVVAWFDHDHEHLWKLDAEPEVEGDTIVLRSMGDVFTVRPLTEDEDAQLALEALNLT